MSGRGSQKGWTTVPTLKEVWTLTGRVLQGAELTCVGILSSFRKQGVGQCDYRDKFLGVVGNGDGQDVKELRKCNFASLTIIWKLLPGPRGEEGGQRWWPVGTGAINSINQTMQSAQDGGCGQGLGGGEWMT